MSRKTRIASGLVAAMILTGGVSACGGDDDATTDADTEAPATSAPATETTKADGATETTKG